MHRCEDVFCYSESRARGNNLSADGEAESSPTATNRRCRPSSITHIVDRSHNQLPPAQSTPANAGPVRISHALARCLTRRLRPTRGVPGPPKQLATLRERAFCWPLTRPASPLSTAAPRVALLTSSPRLGDPARVAGVLGPQALRAPHKSSNNWNCKTRGFGGTIGPTSILSPPSHSSAAAGLPID